MYTGRPTCSSSSGCALVQSQAQRVTTDEEEGEGRGPLDRGEADGEKGEGVANWAGREEGGRG